VKLIFLALIMLLALLLQGCAGTVKVLAHVYDRADPCQNKNQPSFCGASASRTTIYLTPQAQPLGAAIGYTKKN